MMHNALRGVLLTFVLASALSLAVSTASANTLGVNEQDFTIEWSPLNWIAAGTTSSCDVTLNGSFHEVAIEKVEEALLGVITGASIANCQEGAAATILTGDLPWHVVYFEFEGVLPNIEAIAVGISGIALRLDPAGIIPACLFATEAAEPFVGIAELEEGVASTLTADETASIDLESRFLCDLAGDLEFSGAGVLAGVEEERLEIFLEGAPPPERDGAVLSPTPERVVITEVEESDRFTVRNIGDETGTIDRTSLTGVDVERPEFELSSPGCSSTLAVSASCTYTIAVNERPLREAGVTIYYDDGVNPEQRTVSIPVEIQGGDREARLVAAPTSVTIDALEQNDIVEIRNEGGGLSATIDRVTTTTTDTESPEFTVATTGCEERLADDEACHYLISVNSRPEANGRITVEYDDGTGAERTLTIEVDVVGPDPAELEADPTEVVIERLESNDSFVLRNISPDTAALVNRATLTSDDTERPEFSVTGIGCPEIYVAGASCTYVVSVNSRPETDGRYTIEFDDGAGGDRAVSVNVDIAS